MEPKYQKWIEKYVEGDVTGLCGEYSTLLHVTFPELTLTYGTYEVNDYKEGHYWCIDKDGSIIDPTANQFKPGGKYFVGDTISKKIGSNLFDIIVQSAELICKEALLPNSIHVANAVLELIEYYVDLIDKIDHRSRCETLIKTRNKIQISCVR